MATYPPNFNDQGIIDLCVDSGYPVTVDGFYNAINDATGNTNGSIDDIWRLYITDVLGYTFVGQHPAHYGLSFGDGGGGAITFPEFVNSTVTAPRELTGVDVPNLYSNGFHLYNTYPTPVEHYFGAWTETYTLGDVLHLCFPGAAAGAGYTGEGLSIAQNAYIHSAILSLKLLHVGGSVTALRVYGKKTNPTSLPVHPVGGANDAARGWQTNGYLTTAYAEVTPVADTTVTVDIKTVLLEMMAASGWDATDHTVQLCVFPQPDGDGQSPTLAYAVVAAVANAGGVPYTSLSVDYYASTGNAETSPLTSGRVMHYIPVAASDMARSNELRSVAATTTETPSVKTLAATEFAGFTGTTYDTADKSVVIGGAIAELPIGDWVANRQDFFFGTRYHGDSVFSSFYPSYEDGWKLNWRDKDYLFCLAIGTAASGVFTWGYDLYNVDLPEQSSMMMTVNNATGAVAFSGLNAGSPTYLLSAGTGYTHAAGRRTTISVYWDHRAKTWRWRLALWNADGSLNKRDTATHASATAYGPGGVTWDEQVARIFTGFTLSGASNKLLGSAIFEFDVSLSGVWESSADWMTESWVRGIKSLDPRLMVP